MFDQLKIICRKHGRIILAALVALIAAITGCDEKVAWRGVGTDGKDADHSADHQVPQRNATNVKTE